MASAATLLRHRVRRRRASWSPSPSCRATRLDRADKTVVAHPGVWPRPRQPRHRGRCPACSRAWPQIGRFCCTPSGGEGRNRILRRGRCASPMSESFHDRDGSSGRIEEQKRTDRGRYACHYCTAIFGTGCFCADDGEILLRCAARGTDVPFCAEPDQTGWRAGHGAATFPALSPL